MPVVTILTSRIEIMRLAQLAGITTVPLSVKGMYTISDAGHGVRPIKISPALVLKTFPDRREGSSCISYSSHTNRMRRLNLLASGWNISVKFSTWTRH